MHKSTHIPGAGNGSQVDYKWDNNAIQTRQVSQYIARNAGKSIWIHLFLRVIFLDLDISFFVYLRTMSSKNISKTFSFVPGVKRDFTIRYGESVLRLTFVFRNCNWYVFIWSIKFVYTLTTRISVFSSSPTRRPWCSNSQSSELSALFCSHSISKNVILQRSKRVIPSLLEDELHWWWRIFVALP